MRCKKARFLLSASLDGELSPSQERALERHLSVCAACVGDKSEFSALWNAMKEWADEEPSPWLAENFAYRLREFQEERQSAKLDRPRLRVPVSGAAAAGLATVLVAIGLLLHSRVQPPQETIRPPVAIESPAREQSPSTGEPDMIVKTVPVVGGGTENVAVQPGQREPAGADKQSSDTGDKIQSHHPKRIPIREVPSVAVRPVPPISRDKTPALNPQTEQMILAKIVVAKVTEKEVTSAVADDLEEAGLAMSETIEHVRGTLRKAADIVVAQYPAPANDNTYLDGGSM